MKMTFNIDVEVNKSLSLAPQPIAPDSVIFGSNESSFYRGFIYYIEASNE